MPSIESLPADQRAVLELVLRRGRSYDEIARLLSIDRAGVRQRALAALDTLGPQTRVTPDRRALITDYLLDALPSPVASEVRERLGSSASERAWARAVASELADLAERPLPEIPTNGRASRARGGGRRAPVAAATGRGAEPPTATVTEADTEAAPASNGAGTPTGSLARSNGTPRERPPHTPGSRRGGALLLGLLAALALALVLVFVVFGGTGHKHAATAAHRSRAKAATTAAAPRIVAQIPLKPPSGAKSPIGLAEVLAAQNQVGVAIAAEGLPANSKNPPNAYAVWLYNSPSDSSLLGFVSPAVGSSGQLKTAGGLPSNASHFHRLIVTLETRSKPKTPGKIVLEGTLTQL